MKPKLPLSTVMQRLLDMLTSEYPDTKTPPMTSEEKQSIKDILPLRITANLLGKRVRITKGEFKHPSTIFKVCGISYKQTAASDRQKAKLLPYQWYAEVDYADGHYPGWDGYSVDPNHLTIVGKG